ncbi:c-type cytochrome [Rubrivivax gelatinosus]|uniref:Cytochrome C n=1 Tax=Rubrivivax gelatinosus TaxID=28068 RepID=A0ABS1DYZ8_RUBGE|nr:c-type cytochrome [Rubrivivax gelatinosus]MBK1713925.1 cytochrome C [Rubrivivax gelatinosus]
MRARLQAAATALSLLAAAAPATAQADASAQAARDCFACHGPGGNSVLPIFPRLAGQQAFYIEKQLRDFRSGKRQSEVMAPIVAQMNEDDFAALAAFFAAQQPQPNRADDEAQLAAGKALYDDGNTRSGLPACAGCHQPGGLGNERFPRLAGQHAAYTAAQLRLFKSGGRGNDRAKVMRTVAERLSDDEIAAVVQYLASMP